MMFIDKIIDLLFQGVISGLVILFATWWIQKYKEAKLSQKYATLADIELKTHYDALLSIINKYSSDYDSDLASTFGMLALPYLTEMPKENLQFAGSYYRQIQFIHSTLLKSPEKQGTSDIKVIAVECLGKNRKLSLILNDYAKLNDYSNN